MEHCRRIDLGLRIAFSFPPLLYAWLVQPAQESTQAAPDPYIEQLRRLYSPALLVCLNYRTQDWFAGASLMSSRIFFAKTNMIGLDIKFVNREESKGFRLLIRLDGTSARDATKEAKS
jgi:hypothetical protein